MKNKVLVVDLDGTLFTINTFHYFIKYLIFYSLKNFRIILLLGIIHSLTLRVLKLFSHAEMKFKILKLISQEKNINYKEFVDSISNKMRSLDLLKDKSFTTKILATAAPSCYANIIANQNQFDVCLGTEFPISKFDVNFENIKEVKKKNVMAYLGTIGIDKINIFITDHLDDLPLMKISEKNIIFNPTDNMSAVLEENLILFEVIN